MIDIHTHILPGIDDGARDLNESIQMIKKEIASGVNTIVFTSHSKYKNYNKKEELVKKYNLLLDRLKTEKLSVKTYLGEEIYYNKDVLTNLVNGELLTINNTKYILIEFNLNYSFFEISEALYDLKLKGFIPILAHFEIYNFSYNQIVELKNDGYLIQTNASYYIKLNFINKLKFKKYFKNRIIDYIATDCHRIDYRIPNLNRVKCLFRKYTYLNKDIF